MSKIEDSWHEILMTWGAYRCGYTRLGLGYGQSILGRMMESVKGTTCTKCIGRGKIRDIITDSSIPCPLCKGKGRVNVATPGKINPALIRATGPTYSGDDEPEMCTRIDKAFQQLTIRQRIVIAARYVYHPRRNDGDKRIKHVNYWLNRIGEPPISKSRMENLLSEARSELARIVAGE